MYKLMCSKEAPMNMNEEFFEHDFENTKFDNLITNLHVIKQINDKNRDTIDKVTECGIILFNSDQSKLLVVYQNESKRWGLPKGKMDNIELLEKDYMKCAKRELEEETRINLNMNKFKKIGSVIIKNKLFYIISLTKDIRDNMHFVPQDREEIGEVKWIHINNIKTFLVKNDCNITIRNLITYMCPMKRTSISKISSYDTRRPVIW
jgi:ADP-ribose pyrophosphatase YjhB (NUDIX family)